MTDDSGSKDIARYSFLVVFANDDIISHDELQMLEKLALRDGVIDEAEREVLRNVFERANMDGMDEATKAEIADFRATHNI